MDTPKKRMGGRSSRHQHRAAADSIPNPAPPGAYGGMYKPLRDSEVNAIIDAAIRLLGQFGMSDIPDNLAQIFYNMARHGVMMVACCSRKQW